MRAGKESLINLGLGLALILLLAISYISYTRTEQFSRSARWVDHTYNVLLQLNHIMSTLKDAESNQRGFLLTQNEKFLTGYRITIQQIPGQMQELIRLTVDNPEQNASAKEFNELVQRRLDHMAAAIAFQLKTNPPKYPAAENLLENGRMTMDEIRNHAHQMALVEEQLLLHRADAVNADTLSTKRWIIVGNLAAILILILAFWALVAEIRKRRLAQTNAERINAQLEITNKELEGFSYSVSHDLRAPLRAVDGYSRIFEEDYKDKLDEEGLRLLSVIRANSRKMSQLIDDLLQFARSGRKNLEVDSVDMERLVDETWKEVSSDNANPQLVLEKGPLLPAIGDRTLLKQVLANLLSNAIKYSSVRESPRVRIASRPDDKKGVIYEISDNGVGFDMKYYNKLFGVFQRLHSAEEFPGTGVGLAIVQRIIVRHGGQVSAESVLDQGTTFRFNLP